MKVGVLFSGGKDSTFAAYIASKTDQLECLITLSPSRQDSYMFHYPNIRWTALQSASMKLPQIMASTEGLKEKELDDMKEAIRLAREKFEIEGVYTGALVSVYQKSRVERVCSELGLVAISPFWHTDPETHLKNLLTNEFSTIFTSVSALGLDQSWLGRKLDEEAIEDLLILQQKYGLHAALEGGEGETFVLDCPIFEKKIEIMSTEVHWFGDSGFLEIKEAKLVQK
jgi:diphthine-ammonia ligase